MQFRKGTVHSGTCKTTLTVTAAEQKLRLNALQAGQQWCQCIDIGGGGIGEHFWEGTFPASSPMGKGKPGRQTVFWCIPPMVSLRLISTNFMQCTILTWLRRNIMQWFHKKTTTSALSDAVHKCRSKDRQIEQGFMSHSTKNRLFWRCSSQPISRLGTEKTAHFQCKSCV